jgi:hypothetical protein
MQDRYDDDAMGTTDRQSEGRHLDRTGGAGAGTLAAEAASGSGKTVGRPRTRDEATGLVTIRVTVTMVEYLRTHESPGILIEEAIKRTAAFKAWKGKR